MANQQQIQNVRYTHDAMMDLLLSRPQISQKEIAAHFGYREHTISIIINSDAFQEKLRARREELVDPLITATIEERLRAVASTSLDNVLKQLHDNPNDTELSIEAGKLATKAMGFGAKAPAFQQNNYVVQLPARSADAAAWADKYTPGPTPLTIENGSGS